MQYIMLQCRGTVSLFVILLRLDFHGCFRKIEGEIFEYGQLIFHVIARLVDM